MTEFTPTLGVTSRVDIAEDRALLARVVAAFMRAEERACYGAGSQWNEIRRMQDAVVAAIRRNDVDTLSSFLRHPHENYLFYGFEDLGVWSVEAYRDEARRNAYALHCYELLQRLARAMGVLAVPNPEAPGRKPLLPVVSALLGRIERELGGSITPPEPYPSYYGLHTDRGILGERVLNALYCVWRIRQLTRRIANPRILEIGAGLGRLAHYSYRLGLTDYWIVDVPLTSVVQAHFLAAALGPHRLVLDGEEGIDRRDAIKIMNPQRFFVHPDLQFDLVVNVDSLTELGRELASRYLRRVADISNTFFSVNHEVNDFTVSELRAELGAMERIQRSRYWLRDGYVEELFTR